MLLNLMAALSLASIGAVAGILSNPQSVDDAELDKSSLIERKDANIVFVSDTVIPYFNLLSSSTDDPYSFDELLPYHVNAAVYNVWPDYFADGYGYSMDYDSVNGVYSFSICVKYFSVNGFVYTPTLFINGSRFDRTNTYRGDVPLRDYATLLYALDSNVTDFEWLDYNRVVGMIAPSYPAYVQDHQIVSGIASGLTSVQHYATSLVSGFDALALDNGVLTNSMAFAFTLLGIGTAIGICKLTFNWITGRHGM